MSSSILVGSYMLDTLQIYFSWDDDLYTYFKERGLGQSGMLSKKLPLIYTDNCESTTGVHERKRKYIISPEYFGEITFFLFLSCTPVVLSQLSV